VQKAFADRSFRFHLEVGDSERHPAAGLREAFFFGFFDGRFLGFGEGAYFCFRASFFGAVDCDEFFNAKGVGSGGREGKAGHDERCKQRDTTLDPHFLPPIRPRHW